ncbi:MAG: hypothetical protein AAF619_10315 [Pseudomonadota bacterium]
MSRARVIAKFKPGGIVSESAGGALDLIIEAEKEQSSGASVMRIPMTIAAIALAAFIAQPGSSALASEATETAGSVAMHASGKHYSRKHHRHHGRFGHTHFHKHPGHGHSHKRRYKKRKSFSLPRLKAPKVRGKHVQRVRGFGHYRGHRFIYGGYSWYGISAHEAPHNHYCHIVHIKYKGHVGPAVSCHKPKRLHGVRFVAADLH